jgi:hypothetical protein
VSIDRQLPLRRNIWERLANFPYWIFAGATLTGVFLNDVVGFWGSASVAVILVVLAVLLLRPVVRKSRRQRLDGNIERGVVEAFIRFVDDDDGITPNHGWKEGALSMREGGLTFQQLQGPGGKPVGEPVQLERPKTLGRRSFNPGQAVGLDPDFAAFGFLVGLRELEVVLEPAYLKDAQIRLLITGESSAA